MQSDVVSPGYGRLCVNAFAFLIGRERAVGVLRGPIEGSAVSNSFHIVPAPQDNGEYAPKPAQTSPECLQIMSNNRIAAFSACFCVLDGWMCSSNFG